MNAAWRSKPRLSRLAAFKHTEATLTLQSGYTAKLKQFDPPWNTAFSTVSNARIWLIAFFRVTMRKSPISSNESATPIR